MLCLSGDCAEWGRSGLNGAVLAAEQLNTGGGIGGRRIELIIQDSSDTVPSRAIAAFGKLAHEPNLHFIIGPTWSVAGMPLAPIIAKNRSVVVMSPSVGVKDFNETADNIFNDWPADEVATRAIARHAHSRGWRRAVLFGSQDPWCVTQSRAFENEFTRLGGSLAAKVEPLPGARELKPEALRIKAANPDVIVFTNYQADVMAKELRALGVAAPFLAIQMEEARVRSAAGALEGTIFAMYEKPSSTFQTAYKTRFGDAPGISADTAYDALMLFAEAYRRAGSDEPERLITTLQSVKDFHGASGTLSFTRSGSVIKHPVLWRVHGLEYERVEG